MEASGVAEIIFTPLFGPDRKNPGESLSGDGSDLIQTAAIRQEIPKLMQQLNIKTLVDAPCGDFFWMKSVDLGIEKYTGVDVIQALIEAHRRDFGSSSREFLHLDLTKRAVPEADLILCRDCLGHCSDADISAMLAQFKISGSKYLLTTTFPDRSENRSIQTGEWFPINLTKPPFNFPEPLLLINEECTEQGGAYRDKCLGLWRLDDLSFLNLHPIFREPITILTQPIRWESGEVWVHSGVLGSLQRGLRRLGVEFNFNPKDLKKLHKNVLVLNNFDALKDAILLKMGGKIQRLLAGPNLTCIAHEMQLFPQIDYSISPSKWFREMLIRQLPQLKGRFAIWPSGVDPAFWDPGAHSQKTNDVMVYRKGAPEEMCSAVEAHLRARGWNPICINYGDYSLEGYRACLKTCQFAVFLSPSEMQGLALAEAWAMDVPTLVWDPQQSIHRGYFYKGSSSAPYLTAATGDLWKTEEEFERLLDQIPEKLSGYSPRAWVMRNMTDEVSVYRLLHLFSGIGIKN